MFIGYIVMQFTVPIICATNMFFAREMFCTFTLVFLEVCVQRPIWIFFCNSSI